MQSFRLPRSKRRTDYFEDSRMREDVNAGESLELSGSEFCSSTTRRHERELAAILTADGAEVKIFATAREGFER